MFEGHDLYRIALSILAEINIERRRGQRGMPQP
jgi:hypothetical protein